jgi:1,4-dihydroxy-2-naphthoate octaprenyltransferase
MNIDSELFDKLDEYPHVTVSWIGDDGYPVQTAAAFRTDASSAEVRIGRTGVPLPADRDVNVTASHIRPQPGVGYDERRYVSLWGRLSPEGEDMVLRPDRAWGWDEAETPFFEYSERSNAQARRYMGLLSRERDTEVKPRLSPVWTFFLATRLPFLTATIVPVLLGIGIAANDGSFSWWLAIATVIAGAAIHIGLNVANDVFDALSGADEANVNPTQFSGGSRVIQYGLVTLPGMIAISVGAYAVGIGLGLYLVVTRASIELLIIGIVGVLISIFYTAPPFRLVHRGLGELTVALGFGPVMVLGAYVVQTQSLTVEPFVASIPVAILIALVLYVNEIPDRGSDAAVGKRTLPVRFSQAVVTQGFLVAVAGAFVAVAIAASLGVMARPTLIALLAIPIAVKVYQGIQAQYDNPYALMPTMGQNVQLHLVVGILLFAGYMVAVVTERITDSPPAILT